MDMAKKSVFSKRTVIVAAERVRTGASLSRDAVYPRRIEKTRDEIERAFRAASITVRESGDAGGS